MNYNIVLTTAEDIVAVVDAVVAKKTKAEKPYISDFTGIATDDQVTKALQMAMELNLVTYDTQDDIYTTQSFLAEQLVSAVSDEQKAVFMRLILEQYPPYNTFKMRYEFTNSIELACRQTKSLYSMASNERDIKNTLISIATYAKALRSDGANLYSFVEDSETYSLVENALEITTITETTLRTFLGEQLYSFVNEENVFQPLVDALKKSKCSPIDTRSVIVYAANSFESFLEDYANSKSISLSGKTGILSKRDALSTHLSKKHRGMIDFIGQVRNAADHGSDPDENNQMWTITEETAAIYPCIVSIVIKDIFNRNNGTIEV